MIKGDKDKEWCFLDTSFCYFNGNISLQRVKEQKSYAILFSDKQNDPLKCLYYQWFFDSEKDKKYYDVFFGWYVDGD